MADQRGRRDGAGAPRKGGPRQGGAPRKGTSARSGDARKLYDRKPAGRGGKPPTDKRRAPRTEAERKPRTDRERTEQQAVYDGPPLPEDVSGAELSASVRAHLKGLPEKLAARVARHLAAAGQLVDDDPETAYQHTLAAKARAPRIAVVREAVGEAAYAAGHYAEALSELRAAKRMNGATAYLPIMADCHRALGNPTRALELAKSPSVARFVPAAKAEMTLVEAGARRDLGQLDAALRTLEVAPLNSKSRESWVVRLRYAYADTLEEGGRLNDALTWFHKTNAIDADEITDAAARAEALEKRVERD
ncbi:tetratricopeptide repeat protein [Nocardioides humi]|uniref:Tetratricopeptide repeat protein n=1 Tax=Nocardioides humi TaxID=449461 RepID=A0ABN2BT69_9ACTN|nr:tetratricopeptide repeat protein [Nocardioides humi]